MLYAVHCIDVDGVDELRQTYVAQHKQYLRDQAHILVVGGALLEASEQTPVGSLYIVNVADRRMAERFSEDDPFTRVGVFRKITITAMRKSHFNPQAAGS
jgi:uncharacterized protein YciI